MNSLHAKYNFQKYFFEESDILIVEIVLHYFFNFSAIIVVLIHLFLSNESLYHKVIYCPV